MLSLAQLVYVSTCRCMSCAQSSNLGIKLRLFWQMLYFFFMLYNILSFFTKKTLKFVSMSAVYIHIPFCKTRCIYCGFFSTTSLAERERYVDAVCEELDSRREYLKGAPVDTVYFGGGTPSQLSVAHIRRILDSVYYIYNVRERAEITMEGNPDDLTPEYLCQLREAGINRLSMGVQSFDDARLRFLHRRHDASQAVRAVMDANHAGFDNISIDLMFGFPGQTLNEWKADVLQALALDVQHISAYSLMYDDGTLLSRMLDDGVVTEVDEEVSLQMYEYLVDALTSAGYEHYEISNFCKPGRFSRHNSCYWRGVHYLGVGAGAHSYDGETRQYNAESLADYFEKKEPITESLSQSQRYDEFVFTGLRTREGISLSELRRSFGESLLRYFMDNADSHLREGRLEVEADRIKLTRKGVFVSNDVMSDLMYV